MVDKEARERCTYMVESCGIRGHHVSKDFCTPAINDLCRGSKKGNLVVGHMPRVGVVTF